MKEYNISINIDCKRSVLTSESQIHKTEHFIGKTKRFLSIDLFISKIAEGIIYNFEKILKGIGTLNNAKSFAIEIQGGEHIFFFKLGKQLQKNRLNEKDIIFFEYVNKTGDVIRYNDQTLMQYLDKNNFLIELYVTASNIDKSGFNKLYNLSNNDYVNFPLLSVEQERIIKTEDSNMLVQGIAGSGKTNICISKIVYTAARAYYGKVLYTTFSRGLLVDTREKVETYLNNLVTFVQDFENNRIVFMDDNRKKAIENKLGIYFSDDLDVDIIAKVKSIIEFLKNKVDYCLIEDIYAKQFGHINFVGEDYFVKEYTQNTKNHQLRGKLKQIEYLSKEIIYKEIFGMISGYADFLMLDKIISLDGYIEKRKDSFTKKECEIIYAIAEDYYKHIQKENYADNNTLSRKLLNNIDQLPLYSLAIVDEVQDLTEINLYLIKRIARKMFCVGDAMQMINPTYFSFAYLKRLLYEKDTVSVVQLSNNYRNTQKIAQIVDKLGELNTKHFGTHSFVLQGVSVDSGESANSVLVKDASFLRDIKEENFYDITVVVANNKEKEKLKKILKKQEILTVSEIKGLERDTVILYNILSANIQKWQTFERITVNRKKADENSVFRYYFNLLYVGLSRAKANVFVVEDKQIKLFEAFFAEELETLSLSDAIQRLGSVASKVEIEEEVLIERIEQFVKLQQYDNARFVANKILDDGERLNRLFEIDIYQNYLHKGKNREAGIKYWEEGQLERAKRQFEISGDEILIQLVNACVSKDNRKLDVDIALYYTEVENNEIARNIIVETVAGDLQQMKNIQSQINKSLKRLKEN